MQSARSALVITSLVWAAARWLQVSSVGLGVGEDVPLYATYAERWGSGGAPYLDLHPEYPPGALHVFVLPWLWAGKAGYAQAFALEMAIFDLLAACLVTAFAHGALPRARFGALAAGALYVLLSGALFPVLYARFDLVPGALTLLALFLAQRGRWHWAAGVLGAGLAIKLWPLALAPLFLWQAFRRARMAGFFTCGLALGLGALVTAAPVVARSGLAFAEFLQNHRARSLQVESAWATLVLTCRALGLSKARVVANFGALHLSGKLAKVLAQASLPTLLFMVLLPQWLVARRARAGDTAALGFSAAAAVTVGFMVGGKVLSPQYMLWLVPLLVPSVVELRALSPAHARAVALCGASAVVLTTRLFPYAYLPLIDPEAQGHLFSLALVGLRNALLIALYGVLVHGLAAQRRGEAALHTESAQPACSTQSAASSA